MVLCTTTNGEREVRSSIKTCFLPPYCCWWGNPGSDGHHWQWVFSIHPTPFKGGGEGVFKHKTWGITTAVLVWNPVTFWTSIVLFIPLQHACKPLQQIVLAFWNKSPLFCIVGSWKCGMLKIKTCKYFFSVLLAPLSAATLDNGQNLC